MFMYKYLQDVLTTLCFSSQNPILFSSHNICSPCTFECSALSRLLCWPCRIWYLRPGRNLWTHQYHANFATCRFEHKYSTHTIQCDYRCSMVMASLRLWPFYSCGHSILLLWPLCPLQLQFC